MKKKEGKRGREKKGREAGMLLRFANSAFERPTFESDWVMHVLFFLVPTYVN